MNAVRFYQRQYNDDYKPMHENFKFVDDMLQPMLEKRFPNRNPTLTTEKTEYTIELFYMTEVKPADMLGKLLESMGNSIKNQTTFTPHGNLLLQRYRAQIAPLWEDKSNKYLAKLLNQYCEPHLKYICRKGKLYFINITAARIWYVQTKPMTLVQQVKSIWNSNKNISEGIALIIEATGCSKTDAHVFIKSILTQ